MLLLLLACGGPEAWVGPTDAPDVALGVVREGDRWVAYLCGQGEALAWSRWFEGDVGAAATEAGGWSLDVRFDDEGAPAAGGAGLDAVVTDADGVEWVWSGASIAGAGVYEADDAHCRSGAIALDTGLVGTWCDDAGAYAQVDPVDTVRPDDDLPIEVAADTFHGWRVFHMLPARP